MFASDKDGEKNETIHLEIRMNIFPFVKVKKYCMNGCLIYDLV